MREIGASVVVVVTGCRANVMERTRCNPLPSTQSTPGSIFSRHGVREKEEASKYMGRRPSNPVQQRSCVFLSGVEGNHTKSTDALPESFVARSSVLSGLNRESRHGLVECV